MKYLCKCDDDDELMNSEKPPYIENTNWDFSVVYEFGCFWLNCRTRSLKEEVPEWLKNLNDGNQEDKI